MPGGKGLMLHSWDTAGQALGDGGLGKGSVALNVPLKDSGLHPWSDWYL